MAIGLPAPAPSAILRGVIGRAAMLLGTVFGIGLLPMAPGTYAAALALAVYAATPFDGASLGLYLLIGVGTAAGVWASQRLTEQWGKDPRRAVVDEVVGMWTACLFVPKEGAWLLGAFVLFRLLDALKPPPLRQLERLPGGWGVMVDDVAAGLVAAGLLLGLRALIAA